MSAPRRSKLPVALEGWCRVGAEEEKRTVIVRPRSSAEVQEAARDLQQVGAEIVSAGAGAITAVVNPASLRALSELPWVQAVEEPKVLRPLFPHAPSD